MSSDEFWNGKPELLLSYLRAKELKNEREEKAQSQLIDYQAWLTGLYCYQAFGTVMANSFSKKGQQAKYPKEPISFKKKVETENASTEDTLLTQYAGFKALTDMLNRKSKK